MGSLISCESLYLARRICTFSSKQGFFDFMTMNSKTHTRPCTGIPPEISFPVTWQDNAFIRPVQRYERIRLNVIPVILFFLTVGLLIGGAIAIKMRSKGNPIEWNQLAFWDYFYIGGYLSVFLLGFSGLVSKIIACFLIWFRPHRLFWPGLNDIFVCIEETETYKSFKWITEDCGLIRIKNGFMKIEMSRFRGTFPIEDMGVYFLSYAKSGGDRGYGVQIEFPKEKPLWSVVFTPVGNQSFNPLLMFSRYFANLWLIKKIKGKLDISTLYKVN